MQGYKDQEEIEGNMTSPKEHSKLSLTLLDKGFKISVPKMLRGLQKTQVSSLTKSGKKKQTIQEVQYRDGKHKKTTKQILELKITMTVMT